MERWILCRPRWRSSGLRWICTCNVLMWSLMTDVCREMGVRTNVPFKDLTEKEKEIVYDGPMEKKHIFYVPKNKRNAAFRDMNMTMR